MPPVEKIHALRGMRDVLSADFARQRRASAALEAHLRSHAYLPIDLPILENTELFLRKSGELSAERLYEFNFRSRRIALRPEITASALRVYVERLQDELLPLRIQYGGPVFRYEKPQQHRLRQFTLCGAELLGAPGPLADAEILFLACAGLEELAIGKLKLVIGHTDLLDGFLRSLGLRKQLGSFLLRNMENLRKRGMGFVVEALQELHPDLSISTGNTRAPVEARAAKSQQLVQVLRAMSDDEAHQAISDFLRSLNVQIDTNRPEDEVIERLLQKIREDEQAPKLRQALQYMAELSQLVGAPQKVLPDLRALCREFKVGTQGPQALDEILEKLAQFGPIGAEIVVDCGLSRGLHYYTGLMFEVFGQTASGDEIQLCGGGRYDNLISALGGNEPTPALGLAWGIERVASVMDQADAASLNQPDVFVLPLAEADFACAAQVASQLRTRGLVVEISVDERSLRRSLRYADRKGIALVAIIGEDERKQGLIVLRDMRERRDITIELGELEAVVESLLVGKSSDGS